MKWQAKWIWDDSGEHPRNYWVCFKKNFEMKPGIEEVNLHLTADSRYFVYINGISVGNGPVRSWPFELSYDSYSIRDLLKEGENSVSVLVTHYGISTTQYIEGKGGLLGQIEFVKDGAAAETMVTDEDWKTTRHTSYEAKAVRISNCLPWTEIYDAGKFDENWTKADFNFSHWKNAVVVGEDAIQPGTKLLPRDIPYLTEEPIFPRKVVSLKEVSPIPQHISLDFRPNFFPGEYDISNEKHMIGYLTSIIQAPEAMEGYIMLNYDTHSDVSCRFKINSTEYSAKNAEKTRVKLSKGGNLLMIDVSGRHHTPSVHLAFDFIEPVKFRSPLKDGKNQFCTIGPFAKQTFVKIGYPVELSLNPGIDYSEIWNICDEQTLSDYSGLINPILDEHTCIDNVSTLCMFKDTIKEFDDFKQYNNMIFANNSFTTVNPAEKGDTEVIIDFGRELSGFIEFDIDSHDEAILDFFLFESMHDGIIEHTFTLNNTLRYRAKDGRQRYCSLVRRGFRYMMVTIRNLKKPMKIYSMKTNLSTYPVAEVGQFQCSDYLLNRIWEISRDTMRLCMEDTYVDCPAYEQTFWLGDSQNSSLYNYYTFGAYDLTRRCLNLVPGSMTRSPLPESQLPSGWQNVLTAWAVLWPIACKEYYDFTGDREMIEKIYPSIIQAIEGFKKFINPKGLLEIAAWNMLEWAPMDIVDNGIVTHQNALLVKALQDVAFISGELGKEEDAVWLKELAGSIKDSINKYLWSDSEKAYIDSIHSDGKLSTVISVQTNMMVYFCDCAEGERKSIVEKYMMDPPEHFVKIESPYVYYYYFEVMQKLGKVSEVIETIKNVWGNMLDHGATTCWEGWKLIEGHYTRSHCHAWSAEPAYFLEAYVLGVRPAQPGFNKIIIEPKLSGLSWARGVVPTPSGNVEVSCRETDEAVYIDVKIPSTSSARIIRTVGMGKSLIVNGNVCEGNYWDVNED